jgi:prepilin-type N-terminal cleavage/methylation domain-containing protein/prepilin-type processing-associated H-X9-DG protein
MNQRSPRAFTLIELLIVIAIIGILVALSAPELEKYVHRARSAACMNNLREIGVSVLGYVGENDNKYPIIEPNPDDPVYDPEAEATPLLEELEPYGVTKSVLKCPEDKKYIVERGMSYQWRPIVDDENAAAPKIYGGRRGAGVRVVKPSRVTICTDFEGIHFGRLNRLYADGHVVAKLFGEN